MTIAARLRLSFAIMLVAVVAIGGAAAGVMRRTASTLSTAAAQSFEAVAVMEILQDRLREHGAVAAGFVAAGVFRNEDSLWLDRIEADTQGTLNRLAGLDAHSAEGARAVAAEDFAQTRAHLKELAASSGAAAAGADRTAWQRALAALHDRFTRKLTEIRDDQQAAINARAAQLTRQAHRLVLLLAALAAIAAAAIAALFAGIRRRVLAPIQALAAGARRISAERDLTVAVPVSGDAEVRDLGRAFAEMIETLRGITVDVRGATDRLLASSAELGGITHAQGDGIARQASALEEARRTATTLRDLSRQAAAQAEGVLRVAERAESLGRRGERAMTESLAAVEVIQDQTRQVVDRIARLATSAQRIATITATVKDLATQSHVLALNATIEASRAGRADIGFGVVAREVRSLADRSIRATVEVRTVLAEVVAGIRESVALVEAATVGLEEGTVRTRRLGESVAGLSEIVRENLGSVREIADAVVSQGSGISQISSAVEDLSAMMHDTVRSVDATGEAAGVLREVSEQVSSKIGVFRL